MESAPPPYTPGDFSKATPYPTNPNYYPPTGPIQAPYPPTQGPYPPTQAPYPPTQAPYPPQPGYPITQAPGAYPITQAPAQTVIVRAGSCPACGIGTVSKEVTCCGVCCAIIFFPVGIICCIAMMDSRCNNCHAKF